MPPGFVPPARLVTDRFALVPLGPEHNERDHEAWASSIDHIRATPGYGLREGAWPQPMTLDENLADLERHARHFRDREGFTYTVLDGDDVVGCVYVYPDEDGGTGARVRSWVRRSRAELDGPLRRAVADWLASEAWPFASVSYDAVPE